MGPVHSFAHRPLVTGNHAYPSRSTTLPLLALNPIVPDFALVDLPPVFPSGSA
jgi:hypothetical protein